MDFIKVKGAREHNLKDIDIVIPKNKLVVFTGLSGSGKSSMAFDTIYAEGQRRYVESLSSYARQFLGVMDKPDCDQIEGLSPAISIDQKSTSHNPRSTVGTVTEIYDYLRLLFARIGHPHCPQCNREISRLSAAQIVDLIEPSDAKTTRILVMSPVIRDRKGEFTELFSTLRQKGYSFVRLDGKIISLTDDILLLKNNKHSIDVIIDRIVFDKKTLNDFKSRITEAVEAALKLSDGLCIVGTVKDKSFDFPERPREVEDHIYSEKFACPVCNISLAEIEPRLFSFNSPHGACPTCMGLGVQQKIDSERIINPRLTISEGGILPYANTFAYDSWFAKKVSGMGINLKKPIGELTKKEKDQILEFFVPNLERRYKETQSDFVRTEIEKYMRREICPSCRGNRLKPEAMGVTINNKTIVEITHMPIDRCQSELSSLKLLSPREKTISTPILKEIHDRLGFLISVGLEYLTLDRSATTLSGGEAQRIRLASQIGSGLSGVLYVLDEPSIGLHQRDNQRLIDTLKRLRDLGNSVIVVEHDADMMHQSDYIFDFGPAAGEAGGKIIAEGTPEQIMANPKSLTGKYLSGKKTINTSPLTPLLNSGEGNGRGEVLKILGASQNNLKNIDVSFPLGKLITVTGVSGSGKSTLLTDTLYHALAYHFNPEHRERPGAYKEILGLEYINKVVMIDQAPIGRTPRSNPATYTGLFTPVRELFAQVPEARVRGFGPGRFSFNVKGGRCEACLGEGQLKIEMQFLPDVFVNCDICHGTRYNAETLEVVYKGKNIAEILNLTVEQALEFFRFMPVVREKLQTLIDVGLGYIRLGQPAPTLSGGEAQRVKLSSELSRRATGKTFYILDEPTTGLHFADLEKLLIVLRKLVEAGNTVAVIEHNIDVIKNSDWIIDLGPEGGDKGGFVIATGTPSQITKSKESYTGKFLR